MQGQDDRKVFASKGFDGLVHEMVRGGITRKQFLVRALGMGLSVSAAGSILAACGSSKPEDGASSASASAVTDKTKPETLFLYNWAVYLSPKTTKEFTKRTGIKIVEAYYGSSEEMIAKLRGGASGYDLVWPSPYAVDYMRQSGLIRPLDLSLIPNLKNLKPDLMKPGFDPEKDGKKYSVAYTTGINAICVRADKVQEEVTSWDVLWDEKYKRNISMLDIARDVMAAGLLSLRYSLNTKDPAQIDEATEKLIQQKPLVLRYDSSNMVRSVVSGVALVNTWDASAVVAAREIGEDKVAFVVPDEGGEKWADSMCIPIQSPSPYGAHLFINYMCEPEVGAEAMNFTGFQSALAGMEQFITDPLAFKYYPSSEFLATQEDTLYLGEATKLYEEAWTRIKSA